MKCERGAAHIEATFLSLILLIPPLWLLTTLGDVHRAALATSAAARDVGEGLAADPLTSQPSLLMGDAVRTSFVNHGLRPHDARVRLVRTGDRVEVQVSYPVSIARAPFLGAMGPSVWIKGEHAARVDPYRSDR